MSVGSEQPSPMESQMSFPRASSFDVDAHDADFGAPAEIRRANEEAYRARESARLAHKFSASGQAEEAAVREEVARGQAEAAAHLAFLRTPEGAAGFAADVAKAEATIAAAKAAWRPHL